MPEQSPKKDNAARFIPAHPTLESLREAVRGCTACDLYANATQPVFGEGRAGATYMFVGEQPGDVEDRTGRPFSGPAGKLLDRALADAGIERADAFVTNIVKHFKWEGRGKRRIHGKPNAGQIQACLPWFHAELALVMPKVLVCLGATPAQALLGRAFRVTQKRGQRVESSLAPVVAATVHPSSILRAPDSDARYLEFARFVDDLRRIRGYLA